MNRERRRHARIPIDAEAFLTIEDETYTAHLMDLAISGVQVECNAGTLRGLAAASGGSTRNRQLELMFNLPGDSVPVSADCTVNYDRNLDNGNVILGLTFHRIGAMDEARINQYLGKILEKPQ